jgi:MFS family permease
VEVEMADIRSIRPAAPILIGAAVMLSLSMGVRQSLGLVMPSLTRDIAISVSEFTLALSVQNLAWGALQPFAGALVARVGFRPVMLTGAVLYGAGLLLLAGAHGLLGVMIGAGVLIGVALACTASAIALAVASRAVPEKTRSLVLGFITGMGSLGALLSAPIGQTLSIAFGWRAEVLGFFALVLAMLPAAWFAGNVDKIALLPSAAGRTEASARAALQTAIVSVPFLVMAGAYFVCGLQLLFITTHLPSYLAICGMDPMLSAEALGVSSAVSTCSAACSSAGPEGTGRSRRCSASSIRRARWGFASTSCFHRRRSALSYLPPSWAFCGSASVR